MAKIDIVIPCYNYGRFLERCVASVFDQTLQDIRVLIIDDASTDDSAAVAHRLAAADARVSVRVHAHNQGHIATYNEGLIGWASADYSLLLSADDVLTPGALDRAVAVLDANPQVGLVYGHAALWFDGAPPPRLRRRWLGTSIWRGEEWLRIVFQRATCLVSTPTAVVRTSVQHQVGGYRADLPHSGDLEMWMRIAVHADVAYVRHVDQAFYRMHGANMTVQRVPVVDIEQRRAAFAAIFDDYGALIADAEILRRRVNRKLAGEALWRACGAFHRRRLDRTPVAELLEVARAACPDYETLPLYRSLRWRRRVGVTVSYLLQPFMLPAIWGRVQNWLWWKTFPLRGV